MKRGIGLVAGFCGLLASLLAAGCSAGATHARSATAEAAKICAGRTITSDAELTAMAGCTEVHGDLRIRNIASLAPLEALRRVAGTLAITDSPELSDLDGLDRVADVDALLLERDGIYTTSGLEGVRRIGRLQVKYNPRLISIAALNDAKFVGEVELRSNPRLSAYYGLLPGLERTPLRTVIENNRGLSQDEIAALGPTTAEVAGRQ